MGYTVRAETVITLQHGEILGDRLLIAELQDLSLLSRRNDGENLGEVAHSDADCAADANDRCSTTGYHVSLSKNSFLISLKISTCEAEYMALFIYLFFLIEQGST